MSDEEKYNIDPEENKTQEKKKKLPKVYWNVNRFKEDRIKKAQALLELEEIKKKYELETAEIDIEKVKKISSIPVRITRKLEKIFNNQSFGAYYTSEKLLESAGKKLPAENIENADYIPPLLTFNLNKMDYKFIFKLMATVPDEGTAQNCFNILVRNEFSVDFVDIVTVFLNWGASLESLGIKCINIALPKPSQRNNCCGKLFPHNLKYVLMYIQLFHSAWQKHEIILLVLALISASLDETLKSCFYLFLELLPKLLNRLDDTEVVETATLLIKRFKSMDILSAMFVCIDLLPESAKGDLSSSKSDMLATKASYGLLQTILDKEFPMEDDCAWSLLNVLVGIEGDPNSYFQLLYHVIKLVENITIKLNKENTKSKEIKLKQYKMLYASSTNLQSFMKYSKNKDYKIHLDNVLTIKEMLAKLINHSQQNIQYMVNPYNIKSF